jgi:hypothetical protein
MALVINKPTGKRFGDVVQRGADSFLKAFAHHPLFYGGPVHSNVLFFLHTRSAQATDPEKEGSVCPHCTFRRQSARATGHQCGAYLTRTPPLWLGGGRSGGATELGRGRADSARAGYTHDGKRRARPERGESVGARVSSVLCALQDICMIITYPAKTNTQIYSRRGMPLHRWIQRLGCTAARRCARTAALTNAQQQSSYFLYGAYYRVLIMPSVPGLQPRL